MNMDAAIYQAVVKSLPKPIIETLMVLGILTITLTMVSEGRTFEEIIPVLTLFGVAAVKLMPVFNGMINDITTIRYSAPSVYAIYDDLEDRKSTRLNSSHVAISYAVFCLKKKNTRDDNTR